jgi:hypothetical protein
MGVKRDKIKGGGKDEYKGIVVREVYAKGTVVSLGHLTLISRKEGNFLIIKIFVST